jgi:chemotaxis methyl-accepting protein methylase/PAS domain-containing protein
MKKTPPPNSPDSRATEIPSKILPTGQGRLPFPVVGIGASAGGLEALEQFLKNVPEKCGMAYVVIQHLNPTLKGALPELLQRATGMKVFEVTDRMQVKPDSVYVIPPNKDLSILHGVLYLFEPKAPRGLRLPIDSFLRSLAEDQQESSIGVILSGMGSDGTIGLRAIKEQGGLALVQEPASAKFDSMPRSAIAEGLADIVAPVGELPGKILDYLRHASTVLKKEAQGEVEDWTSLEKILLLLRAKTGHDFAQYKQNTLCRRIERRMGIHQIDRTDAYIRFLQTNPQELELLFKELLIGVTCFFRDPAAWEQLKVEIIPDLLRSRPSGSTMRAWSVGCSTGEEAYSLAMIFKEALEQVRPDVHFKMQIFATDLDRDAIDKARQAVYPANIVADVSPERLRRFFVQEATGYRIGKEIREMVTFATHNVIMDAPFTKLDILICRNLLIYLRAEVQKLVLPLFHYSLNPGGIMFLGSAETADSFSDLFQALNLKLRLFRRRESVVSARLNGFPSSFATPLPEMPMELTSVKPAANLQFLAHQLLLQHFSPPAVLVSEKGDILYINGRTGKYLEPAAGKANWNIFAMARDGIRFELGSAFQKVNREKGSVTIKGLKVGTNGGTQMVDVTVKAIEEPVALQGMVMIVFADAPMPPAMKKPSSTKKGTVVNARVVELEQELKQVREDLLTIREEMQSSQEELKSTNEELQSTNEELITSKEEMQSLNEELQTVNAEQQSKMNELARTNNDMRNLLNSTEIVTVFLDNDLNVRRFTAGANKIFKLIPGDVGRPLNDIKCDLLYPEMIEAAREVLRTLVFSEKQVASSTGRWFSVRIMPYRTMEDVIGGVVITFSDITATKTLEAELRQENAELKKLLQERSKN